VKPKYAGKHQAMRRAGLPYAYGKACVRCGKPMLPGQPLDLDHRDDGNGWAGFAHSSCNRSAGATLGNVLQSKRKKKGRSMLTKCSLGIQISEDRRHTSVAVAGWVGDEVHAVLAAYLDDTDPAATVVKLKAERLARRVVVDPHSPGATTIQLLAKVGVRVVEMSSSDLQVAFGNIVDGLRANLPDGPNVTRVKVPAAHPFLSAAMQHADEKPQGGATTWQRRGIPVDMSPLDACTFAVWSALNRPSLPAIY
jgi:hypothetical protein